MKTVFSTHVTDDWFDAVRTSDLIKSAKHWHPEIPFVVFSTKDIKEAFDKNKYLNWNNLIPHFCNKLADKYDLVVHIDADSLITGPLDELLKGDYEVAAARNNNDIRFAGHLNWGCSLPAYDITTAMYVNAGLVASTIKDFWDIWDNLNRSSHIYPFGEQDILNILFYDCGERKFQCKVLDPVESNLHYGVSATYGQSKLQSWRYMEVKDNELYLNNKKVKVLHEAGGHQLPKMEVEKWVKPDVMKYLFGITGREKEKISLFNILGQRHDLEGCDSFYSHYKQENNLCPQIMEELKKDSDWLYKKLDRIGPEKDLVIIDLGANVGLYSIFLSEMAKVVYAVEPYRGFYNILVDLLDETETRNVIIVPCAVGGVTAVRSFEVYDMNTSMSRFSTGGQLYGPPMVVYSVKFSDLLKETKVDQVDFLKIDVEGAEMEILMSESFAQEAHRVRSMYVELHGNDIEYRWDNVNWRLTSLGYEVERIDFTKLYAERKEWVKSSSQEPQDSSAATS